MEKPPYSYRHVSEMHDGKDGENHNAVLALQPA